VSEKNNAAIFYSTLKFFGSCIVLFLLVEKMPTIHRVHWS